MCSLILSLIANVSFVTVVGFQWAIDLIVMVTHQIEAATRCIP